MKVKIPILPNWLIVFFHKKLSYLLSQEKFIFSDKSLQFNVNYSHARVFTLQLYIRLSRY